MSSAVPDTQPRNSLALVWKVSMNRGSNSGGVARDARPGSHVVAEITPASLSHGSNSGA
jgi:hypothetical protein